MPRSKASYYDKEDTAPADAIIEYRQQSDGRDMLHANAAIDLHTIEQIGDALLIKLEGDTTARDMVAVSMNRARHLHMALQRLDVICTAFQAGGDEAIKQRNEALSELKEYQQAVTEGRIHDARFRELCQRLENRARKLAVDDAMVMILADSADAVQRRFAKLGYPLDMSLCINFVNALYSPDEPVSNDWLHHIWTAIHATQPAPEAAAV